MTKFVESVDELQLHEKGYNVASKEERRNKMREMEASIQKRWQEERTFEEDANATAVSNNKFFCNFPYPYMNGLLHLGHAFTITKADFAARYQRLKGKKVLFPFAFHCTGMPIQAAANKLKREIEDYGLENCQAGIFDLVQETGELTLDDDQHQREPRIAKAAPKGSGKTKLMAKTGAGPGKRPKTQWEILQLCDMPDHEIPNFLDPQYWLKYFPRWPWSTSSTLAFTLTGVVPSLQQT